MNAEGRYVAAVLYPPQKLVISESDSLAARVRWMDPTESQSGDLLFGTDGSNPVESVRLLVEKVKEEFNLFPLVTEAKESSQQKVEEKTKAEHQQTVKQLNDPLKP